MSQPRDLTARNTNIFLGSCHRMSKSPVNVIKPYDDPALGIIPAWPKSKFKSRSTKLGVLRDKILYAIVDIIAAMDRVRTRSDAKEHIEAFRKQLKAEADERPLVARGYQNTL